MPRREEFRVGQHVCVLDIMPRSMMSEFGGQIGTVTNIESTEIRADVPSSRDGRNRSLVFSFNFLEIVDGNAALSSMAALTVYAVCSAQIDHENAVVGVFSTLGQIYAWTSTATWLGNGLVVDGESIFVARHAELLVSDSERPVLHIRAIPINTMLDNTSVSENLGMHAAEAADPLLLESLMDFDDGDYDEEEDDEQD